MPVSFKFEVPTLSMAQPNEASCWLASYRILWKYWGRTIQEIPHKLKAGGINYDEAFQNGLVDYDYKKAADALELQAFAGSTFNKKQGFFDIGLSDGAEAFLEKLMIGPLWVTKRGKYNSHAVVANGYDDSNQKILFVNPWSESAHAKQDYLRANTFVRNISNTLGSVQF